MAAVVAAFPCGSPVLGAVSLHPRRDRQAFWGEAGAGGDGSSWCLGRVSTLDNYSPPPFNILPDFTHKCIFIYSDKLFVSKSSSALMMSSQLQD